MNRSRQLKHVRMELQRMVSPQSARSPEDIWPPSIQEIREILAAIKRIDDGDYGYCICCNKRIPDERLEARPHAARCLCCQQQIERRRVAV